MEYSLPGADRYDRRSSCRSRSSSGAPSAWGDTTGGQQGRERDKRERGKGDKEQKQQHYSEERQRKTRNEWQRKTLMHKIHCILKMSDIYFEYNINIKVFDDVSLGAECPTFPSETHTSWFCCC
jgi:hypothetical protein